MEESSATEEKFDFNSLKDHLKDYVNNRLEYFKLTAIENIASAVPAIVLMFILMMLFFVFWILCNIAAVYSLGKALDNMAMGLLIVAVCNLILAILVAIFYKGLIARPLGNMIVKNILKNNGKNDHK